MAQSSGGERSDRALERETKRERAREEAAQSGFSIFG